MRNLPSLLFASVLLTACETNVHPSPLANEIHESTAVETMASDHLSGQATTSSDHIYADTTLEKKIMDTLLSLPELQRRAHEIDKKTAGKRHLKMWIADSPHPPEKAYYWVKAGEDNGVCFVSHFNFYVYPDSMRIMYFDTQCDRVMDLEEWRNKQSTQ